MKPVKVVVADFAARTPRAIRDYTKVTLARPILVLFIDWSEATRNMNIHNLVPERLSEDVEQDVRATFREIAAHLEEAGRSAKSVVSTKAVHMMTEAALEGAFVAKVLYNLDTMVVVRDVKKELDPRTRDLVDVQIERRSFATWR